MTNSKIKKANLKITSNKMIKVKFNLVKKSVYKRFRSSSRVWKKVNQIRESFINRMFVNKITMHKWLQNYPDYRKRKKSGKKCRKVFYNYEINYEIRTRSHRISPLRLPTSQNYFEIFNFFWSGFYSSYISFLSQF